jgi:hypothetical protein
VLGFTLRSLQLLGKHSPTCADTHSFSALIIFQIGSHIFAWGWLEASLLHLPPIYPDNRCEPPLSACILWWVFLPRQASNRDPSISTSHLVGITDMSHHTWLGNFQWLLGIPRKLILFASMEELDNRRLPSHPLSPSSVADSSHQTWLSHEIRFSLRILDTALSSHLQSIRLGTRTKIHWLHPV